MLVPLKEAILNGQLLVGDGGMGTSLYDKGFFINRSFEELSLTHADDVRSVVQGFKDAGANLLSTNTFGANIPKLTQYGLQGQLKDMIETSVQINRAVAGNSAYVMGSVGPLGLLIEPLGATGKEEAEALFRIHIETLLKAGVDGFILETFHDLNELEAAIKAVASLSPNGVPVIAMCAVRESLKTSYGHGLEEFVKRIEPLGVDVMGLNCEVGPSFLLEGIETLRSLTSQPLAVFPNAGLPRYVNDRYIYMSNPDYFGKFAKRFVQAGAQIIGGCCGTNHLHVRAISNALRMNKTATQVEKPKLSKVTVAIEPHVKKIPLENRSQLAQKLYHQEFVVSVELVPPVGVVLDHFLSHCTKLKNHGVKFVNIPDGARAVARISSLHLAALVKREIGIEPIPHFTSRDRNLIGLQSDLLGAYANGIRNILLVTGDPPKLGSCPDATAVYDVDSIGLTHIANRLNCGLDLGGAHFGGPTGYNLGVALNPTSLNPDLEFERFKYKIEAGANFCITQPIYDVPSFMEFFSQRGTSPIPVIVGIWPLVSLKNAEFLKYEVPGVSVPDWVIVEMEKAGDNKSEGLKRGHEIAVKTMEKLRSLVAGFQISAPFNRVEVALNAIDELNLVQKSAEARL